MGGMGDQQNAIPDEDGGCDRRSTDEWLIGHFE
jgi:hypothetical protein